MTDTDQFVNPGDAAYDVNVDAGPEGMTCCLVPDDRLDGRLFWGIIGRIFTGKILLLYLLNAQVIHGVLVYISGWQTDYTWVFALRFLSFKAQPS
jgi:hypothetical protein